MILLIATPPVVWRHPAVDEVYSGFDPNLVFVASTTASSTPKVTTSLIDLSAGTEQSAAVNFVTTTMQRLDMSVDATVANTSAAGETLRIGVWSPRNAVGYFLVFNALGRKIDTETRIRGSVATTLAGGTVERAHPLGFYVAGATYRIQIAVDKSKQIQFVITGATLVARDSITVADLPDLFGSVRIAITASAQPLAGNSRILLSDYQLALPHEAFWVDKVDDARERIALVALLILGSLLVVVAITTWLWRQARQTRRLTRGPAEAGATKTRVDRAAIVVVTAACFAYLIGNWLLFPLGGHPFDFGNEQVYAYVARAYGPVQLYYLPNLVSLASTWGGVPYIESAFPYEPVIAYLSTAIGWVNSLISGGGAYGVGSVSLGYLIKAANVLFGLADAVVLYLILRELELRRHPSLVVAGLFLFNPAVWFSMSIWGQTHVISIFFVLAAVLMAERRHPVWAWSALAAACLTRPQMLVFGVLLAIVLLRKFTWMRSMVALSWTTILTFLALAPFTLATSPSLPVDIMLSTFRIQEGGGNDASLTTVSQDAYSVWPLVTYFAQGIGGLGRAFTPSSTLLIGSVTYQRLSQILVVVAILLVSAALLLQRQTALQAGSYLPLVALGITSFLMLLTGIVATHFVLALPFLLLSYRWMGKVAFVYVIVIWTVTTFVPMYGDMGLVISTDHYPVLAPAHNAITRFFIGLYTQDRFITLGVVANICAVIWLAFLSFRPTVTTDARAPTQDSFPTGC